MTYKVESTFIEKGLSSLTLGNESIKVDVSKDRDESMPGCRTSINRFLKLYSQKYRVK